MLQHLCAYMFLQPIYYSWQPNRKFLNVTLCHTAKKIKLLQSLLWVQRRECSLICSLLPLLMFQILQPLFLSQIKKNSFKRPDSLKEQPKKQIKLDIQQLQQQHQADASDSTIGMKMQSLRVAIENATLEPSVTCKLDELLSSVQSTTRYESHQGALCVIGYVMAKCV